MPRSLPSRLRLVPVVLVGIGAIKCGSSPAAPSPPPPALALTCPAAQTISSSIGLAIVVTFPPPAASGGTAPITTLCSPPSGANYAIGTTRVTCSASDAKQQTASCTFNVIVTAPPQTSVTRYVAFGDSITEGFEHTVLPRLVDPAPVGSYPAGLLSLMQTRYTAQTIFVFDEGVGGERVADGLARLPPVLNLDNPGALLLLEGANDLNAFGAAAPDIVVSGLRQMVRIGKGRSLSVFIGTLLPERPGGKASYPGLVVPTNDAIKAMAASEGAILVDLYQAFGATPDPLISSDGLHPNAAGNTKIAETFFEAIRMRLETAGTSTLAPFGR